MKPAPRIVLPLVAAGVLLAALAVVLWPSPSVTPAPKVEAPAPVVAAPAPVVEAAPAAPRAQPAPAPVSAPVAATPLPEGNATVVPIQPGDTVPEPERTDGPPQQNDPIQPEKPQTARWKLAKTERMTTLLGRDVERLERERDQAESQGHAEEAQRLAMLVKRHRENLGKLRKEMEQLSEAAKNEPPEEP